MHRIVLIGAGSTNFGLGVVGDIFKSNFLEGSTIILHDINAKALDNTFKIASEYKEKLGKEITIESTTSRKEALKGASFCLISIEVGNRFDLWDQDWKIPLQYGVKQVYGENGGPGGLFHSLRIIPPILEICEDIQAICPDAYVFNYSNPMQRVCHAVTTKFPDLKFIGLCHEIESMRRQLPSLMETELSNIEFRAGGLNHFSILLDAKFKNNGKDGYPLIKKNFWNYFKDLVNDHEGFESEPGAERGVFFKIYEDFKYLPITTDSHLGEYVQWAYSVADHEAILHFYDNYKKKCLTFFENDKIYSSFFDLKNDRFHERFVPIAEAIIEDQGIEESSVNIPNNGFIDCLPKDIVVEVPAIVDKKGIKGIALENYPKTFGSLLNLQSGVIQLTTQSVLEKSKHKAYLALLADPVVASVTDAEKLLNNMITVQHKHLSYLN
jgi:alpha-galactosidase